MVTEHRAGPHEHLRPPAATRATNSTELVIGPRNKVSITRIRITVIADDTDGPELHVRPAERVEASGPASSDLTEQSVKFRREPHQPLAASSTATGSVPKAEGSVPNDARSTLTRLRLPLDQESSGRGPRRVSTSGEVGT